MSLYIIGILACLLGSAFFSASEMSYSSCNRIRLEHMAENGSSYRDILYHYYTGAEIGKIK